MFSTKYQEYSLPSFVDSYIIDRFKWPRALGKALLSEKDVSKARKVTLLSEGTSVESIVDYEDGGITSRESSISWLVEKMQCFLNQENDRVIIFQDAFAKKEDPYIQKSNLQILSYRDEVYFAIFPDKSQEPEYIKETLIEADSHFLLGIMSSLPKSYLPLGSELNLDLITTLAGRTEHVIVSAFDEEGYIICSFK
ncbi:MAG: hypothetical protein ACYS0I_02135 [Planctomycetota bacterium]|jgi:hypothetical protein